MVSHPHIWGARGPFWAKDQHALFRLRRGYPWGFASLAAVEQALSGCYRPPLAYRRLGRALLRYRPFRWAYATRLGRYLYYRGAPVPAAAYWVLHGWQCEDLPYQLVPGTLAAGWQVHLLFGSKPCAAGFQEVFSDAYFATRSEALKTLVDWRDTVFAEGPR